MDNSILYCYEKTVLITILSNNLFIVLSNLWNVLIFNLYPSFN